jgi:hypothetical protein
MGKSLRGIAQIFPVVAGIFGVKTQVISVVQHFPKHGSGLTQVVWVCTPGPGHNATSQKVRILNVASSILCAVRVSNQGSRNSGLGPVI